MRPQPGCNNGKSVGLWYKLFYIHILRGCQHKYVRHNVLTGSYGNCGGGQVFESLLWWLWDQHISCVPKNLFGVLFSIIALANTYGPFYCKCDGPQMQFKKENSTCKWPPIASNPIRQDPLLQSQISELFNPSAVLLQMSCSSALQLIGRDTHQKQCTSS